MHIVRLLVDAQEIVVTKPNSSAPKSPPRLLSRVDTSLSPPSDEETDEGENYDFPDPKKILVNSIYLRRLFDWAFMPQFLYLNMPHVISIIMG